VQTVIAHLVRGNQNTAAAAEGRPRQPNPIADVGGDPKGAYRASADEVKRAWHDSSQLQGLYETALGTMPGQALLSLRLSDNVTHGWDLARATGQAPAYDEEVVAAALAFAEAQLAGGRAPGGPFAPPVPLPDDAPAIDRLAAFLGRNPS
jgi:uncharacterized protein (TIGR03086 family)